jgi:hypothetical protein
MHGPTSAKKLQLKAYAKTDAELPESQRQTGTDCIPVMVSITAPSGMEAQREPVDLVIVLHVRKGRNVPEKWQELLKVALEIVTGKLDTKDCLAVVPFMPSLLPMSEKNAKAVLEKYKPESIQTDTSLVIDLESAESVCKFEPRSLPGYAYASYFPFLLNDCTQSQASCVRVCRFSMVGHTRIRRSALVISSSSPTARMT